MSNEENRAQEPEMQPRGKGHGCLWLLILLCAAGAAAYFIHQRYPQFLPGLPGGAAVSSDEKQGKPGGSGGPARPGGAGGPPMKRSVSVAVATAQKGDLPIYLNAPGTVTALNTVTVRTRVDGQIVKVNYEEGQTVHEGDLLVQIDPRPYEVQLAQAQGQLARDEASLKFAKADLARNETALKAVSEQQLGSAQASVGQLEGAVMTDRAQIENAKLQLTYCRLTAPISGQIGLRLVDQGNMVHANDPNGLTIITQNEPITVTFSLAEGKLPQVLAANGDKDKKLLVDVFSCGEGVHLAAGTLLAVDSQIDLQTLTVKFKAIFDNKDHALFPNQAVSVRLLVETKKDTVLVPVSALQPSPKTSFVYVVKDDSTVEMRPIELGPAEGETGSVAKGLSVGEVVVTAGADNLESGMKVSVPGKEGATGGGEKGAGKRGARRGGEGEGEGGRKHGEGGWKRGEGATGEGEGEGSGKEGGWKRGKKGDGAAAPAESKAEEPASESAPAQEKKEPESAPSAASSTAEPTPPPETKAPEAAPAETSPHEKSKRHDAQ